MFTTIIAHNGTVGKVELGASMLRARLIQNKLYALMPAPYLDQTTATFI